MSPARTTTKTKKSKASPAKAQAANRPKTKQAKPARGQARSQPASRTKARGRSQGARSQGGRGQPKARIFDLLRDSLCAGNSIGVCRHFPRGPRAIVRTVDMICVKRLVCEAG